MAIDYDISPVLYDVDFELNEANKKFPPFKSTHEAYAVILEEMDEFWDEVKKKEPDKVNMRNELIQIAAMCVKTIENFNL